MISHPFNRRKRHFVALIWKESGGELEGWKILLEVYIVTIPNSALNHSSGEHEFKSGGLGLGLSAVKSILTAHGTTCEVVSTPGKGSTFSFTLPAV